MFMSSFSIFLGKLTLLSVIKPSLPHGSIVSLNELIIARGLYMIGWEMMMMIGEMLYKQDIQDIEKNY